MDLRSIHNVNISVCVKFNTVSLVTLALTQRMGTEPILRICTFLPLPLLYSKMQRQMLRLSVNGSLKHENWYTYGSFSSAWKYRFWTVLFLHTFCKSFHTIEVVFPTFNAISRFLDKSACTAGCMLTVSLTVLLLICVVAENRQVRWNLFCHELFF